MIHPLRNRFPRALPDISRALRYALTLTCLCAVFAGCSRDLDFDVKLIVVDESGAPVADAVIVVQGDEYNANKRGEIRFKGLTGATMGVIRADGYLAEPVTFGWDDKAMRVRLLSSKDGKRWVMHATGDVMFGRRYNEPPSGEPLIPALDPGQATRAVVAHVAPAFAAADFRTINLETVVSDMPLEAAYPRKRFILNSWPETVEGIDELQADAVDLANNHARDYMDEGVAATIEVLEAAGIPYFGGSVGPDGADDPVITTVNGITVGALGWTTVEGSFVNDNYPSADDPVPDDLSPDEAWQYDLSTWGYDSDEWSVPVGDRRIGEVWRLFKAKEDELSEAGIADAWASIVAVYPGMQDWVARRGHGGAALWERDKSKAAVEALDAVADVVVVQLHSGFQFQRAPSSGTRNAARHAIDSGADIVICHHPHVLQGAEWYNGKLIVYSLGNFVFDQDFLATFPSAFLRTVWDEDELIEARFVPVELIGYKTRPVADQTARRTLMNLWEMSQMRAQAGRDRDGDIYVYEREPDEDTVPATLRLERNTARVLLPTEPPPATQTHRLSVDRGRIVPIGFDGLIDPRMGLSPDDAGAGGIEVGRDLLRWGRFEDEVADGVDSHGSHWALTEGSTSKTVIVDGDTADGVGYLRLTRYYTNEQSVLARPVARIPLWWHRLHREREEEPDTYEPMDPEPSYSIRFRARRKGKGEPSLSVRLYHFDDTNPTEDPSSAVGGCWEPVIDIPNDNEWHHIHIDIPDEVFYGLQNNPLIYDCRSEPEPGEIPDEIADEEEPINMVLLYIRLEKPYKSKTTFDIDELEFLEWRDASQMPDRPGAFDYVRNDSERDRDLSIVGVPSL